MSQLSVHDIVGLSAYDNKIRIPSGHMLELNGNMKVPVWTEGSKPQNPETGLFGYNTTLGVAELYDGNEWVTVGQQRLTGTTQDTAGYAAAEVTTALSAPTPTQRWIKPDQIQPFQIYVADNMASLGVVPSGGPNWVYNIKGLNIISRSIINQTDTMLIDYDDFLKLVQRLYGGGTSSPYIYWSIWDIGNQELIGITRTYFTNGDFATWRDHHTGDNPPSLSPYGGSMIPHWDVWATTARNGTAYTITNDTSQHVRSIPYRNNTSIVGGSYSPPSYGLHYKRNGSGEHYPWRNSADVNTSEGYFYPSSSYSFYGYTGPTGNGIVHYIFVAEN
jgi:hypothetical protein